MKFAEIYKEGTCYALALYNNKVYEGRVYAYRKWHIRQYAKEQGYHITYDFSKLPI